MLRAPVRHAAVRGWRATRLRLTATGSDMTLADLATIADVFYIGGTKVGALFGEAVVFTHDNTPKHFLTLIKQHGALLAKGFVLGAQFDALFTDNLYFKIARNATMRRIVSARPCAPRATRSLSKRRANQIFVTLDNEISDRLERDVRLALRRRRPTRIP